MYSPTIKAGNATYEPPAPTGSSPGPMDRDALEQR